MLCLSVSVSVSLSRDLDLKFKTSKILRFKNIILKLVNNFNVLF